MAHRRVQRLLRHVQSEGKKEDDDCADVKRCATAACEQPSPPCIASLLLKGQAGVVTGAASGIGMRGRKRYRLCCCFHHVVVFTGKATALLLASRGASVVVADVSDDVSEVAEEIKAKGGRGAWHSRAACWFHFSCAVHSPWWWWGWMNAAITVVSDITQPGAAESLVKACWDAFGTITFMFANAGIGGSMTPPLDLDQEEWESVFQVNVFGAFHCVKAAAAKMSEQGIKGSIVVTASVAGLRSGAGGTPYSASKAAVNSMVQTCAWGLYKQGIRVNSICPGLIRTGMTELLFVAAEARGKAHMIGQVGGT